MKIIIGRPEIDGPSGVLDTETGAFTGLPGNRGGGPNSYQDIAHAVHSLKAAATIKDDDLRVALTRPAGHYVETALATLIEARDGVVAIA
jgi:hypothetical protein